MARKIAINGFGRIGRLAVRAIYENKIPGCNEVELVFINSPGTTEDKRYLLKYDSVHGPFEEVGIDGDSLIINGISIKCTSHSNPSEVDCSGVDLLIDCSGTLKEHGSEFIKSGAKKVLISAPANAVDQTVIYGITPIAKDAKIISAGSCTTNCLALLLDFINRNFGIVQASATSIHSYTNDQRMVDSRHKDKYRGRAAALSIIPTKTGAEGTIYKVMPELIGKITCAAYRVPTPNVSLLDIFVVPLDAPKDIMSVNQAALEYSKVSKQAMGYNDEKLVSADFNHTDNAVIFDACLTNVGSNSIKVSGWYDNEWGFVSSMIKIALEM